MRNFSTTFHKKFHIKFFLTKNYGFYVKNGRNLRPTLYVFHMYFSYVFFICGFHMCFLYVFFCKCCFFNSIFRRRLGKPPYSGFFLITPY